MSARENVSAPARMGTVIAALWTGNLFAPFVLSGIAAILPAIGVSLGASAVMLSLVMVAYNMGQSISHMLSGRIADMFGVKRTMLIGLGGFCMISVGLGLVPSIAFFIPFRFVQGLFAAAIACTITTLTVAIAPKNKRAQVISAVMSAVYLGLSIGPVSCGGLAETLGWRWVFFLVASAGLADLLLLWRIIPEQHHSDGRKLDLPGALLGTFGIMAVSMGVSCTFLHPAVLGLLPAGLLLLALFVRREWISSDPILDLKRLSKVPGLPYGMAAVFINFGSFMGLSLLFSLYLQHILGLDAFRTGMIFMVQTLFQLAFTSAAGKLADRYSPWRVFTFGLALCGAAIFGFLLFDEHTAVGWVAAGQAVLGIGAAFFVAPNMAATLGNVPSSQLSVASGLLGCLRTMGGLVSHITVACMIGFFMGNTAVTLESAGLFLNAMKAVLLLFGVFNMAGVAVSIYAVRRYS